ncbi:hypothetical protein DFH11DRAFT_1503901 [Phellopilus nigrolimitatus]|nr:hypothetical protein DFH11DRAFT_1503901 [Phellopilus nigrolimitatus]
MSSANIRQSYKGIQLGIVIGIDVGTTFSGVSYAILRPGQVPDVLPVTRFSGSSTGAHKIPSVIFYDDKLAIKAIGPLTTVDSVLEDAEDHGWFKSRRFKMHLRPRGMPLKTNGLDIGDLPPGKSAEEVMGDFLHYLLVETARYIQMVHADGADLWSQIEDRAIFVLGHPNGWTGREQQRYRNSAILGGLVPDTVEGRMRVKFVTEGEASALACLLGGLNITKQVGFRFIIAVAGGATLDISSYEVSKSYPVELQQCAPPDCRFAGSIFVDRNGLKLLEKKLQNSVYDDDDVLEGLINDEFEKKTKRKFAGDSEYELFRVGDRRVRDDNLGIRNGFLRLNRDELSECFSMSVTEALDSIRSQVTVIRRKNETIPVWLVGGFASSPYLLKRLNDSLEHEGVSIQRPDTNLTKAVADGAVLHFLDNPVASRVCPASYGITRLIPFNSSLSDHIQHSDLIQTRKGVPCIGPVFDCIVEKGTRIEEAKTFKMSFLNELFSRFMAERFTVEILVYDGDLPVPTWFEENKHKFRTLCEIEADLSDVCTEQSSNYSVFELLVRNRAPDAFPQAKFDIELKFGTTELEARIKWEADVCVPFTFNTMINQSHSQGKTKQ